MSIHYDPGIVYNPAPIYGGLSNLGQGIAQGIQEFSNEHKKIAIADEVMQQLRKTPDPSDPEGKRAVVDDKTYERFLAAKGDRRAAVAEGLLQKLAVQTKLSDQAIQERSAESLNRYRGMTGAADLIRAQQVSTNTEMPSTPAAPGTQWVQSANGRWYMQKIGGMTPQEQNAKRRDLADALGVKGAELPEAIASLESYQPGKTPFPKFGRYKEAEGDVPPEEKGKMLAALEQYRTSKVVPAAQLQQTSIALSLTPRDQLAYQWAKSHPNDPRSAAIIQRLGL